MFVVGMVYMIDLKNSYSRVFLSFRSEITDQQQGQWTGLSEGTVKYIPVTSAPFLNALTISDPCKQWFNK